MGSEMCIRDRAIGLNRVPCLCAFDEVSCQACLCDWTTAVHARNSEAPIRVPLHFPPTCKWSAVAWTRVSFRFGNAFPGMCRADVVVKVINPSPVLRLFFKGAVRAQLMHAYYGDLTCVGLTISLFGIWYFVRRSR